MVVFRHVTYGTYLHYFQTKQAIFNLKHVNGRADVSGPAVQLGCEEKYYPTCAEW